MRLASCWLPSTAGLLKGLDTRDLKDAKALLDELVPVTTNLPRERSASDRNRAPVLLIAVAE